MRLLTLLVVVPTLAFAQFLPPGSSTGGGGTPDPGRADVAASYNATGPNGLRLTPQTSLGALGACASLSGAFAVVSGTPSLPYYCDGSQWVRVWNANDGTVANGDVHVPGYSFVAQAPSGEYAFRILNNGARADFGGGSNDHFWSDGSQIISEGSIKIQPGQSLTANIIGSSSGGIIQVYPGSWVVYQGVGALATCDATSAGGLIRLTSDGRPYWCDGAGAYRVMRAIPISATLSIPTMTGGGEATVTTTVTGAAVGEHVTINMTCSLAQVGIRRVRVSSADTVSIVVFNGDPATPNPATPTDCLFVGEVHK